MNTHLDILLPFYANRTLPARELASAELHLAACPHCRARLAEWQELAATVNQAAGDRLRSALEQELPARLALSPLVYASLKRRPPLHQVILSAANLICAQRIFLTQGWFIPTLGAIILLGVLALLVCQGLGSEWVVFPLFAVIPIVAALSAAFLYTSDDDPAFEIISAAPTSPGTLVFARLTLSLGAISLVAFLCSLLLAVWGSRLLPAPRSLFDLVAVWLGPMLMLSALTTVLSLCLRPRATAGVALVAWGMVVILLTSEQAGTPVVKFSLLPLLHPGWALLAGQILLAGVFYLVSWLWLSGSALPSLRLERGG